jgi:RND family efflux transporter MFP subunit
VRSLSFLLAISASAAACSSPRDAGAPEAAPIALSTAVVESSNLAASFEAGGVLAARLTAVVSSRMLAPIAEVRVRPGDRVRKGQVLIQLDARESQARAAGSTSALAAAEQALKAAEAEERSADSALKLARLMHDRVSQLVKKGSATVQELDEAVAALDMATARLASVQAHREEALAAVAASRSSAEALGIAASYAEITAPFDGMITSRSADPGTIAQPGAGLLTIDDTAGLRLEVRVDEAQSARITLGQTADVRIDGADPAAAPWISGRVAEVARLDPSAHSFVVKLDVPSDPAWRPGFFGRARFAGAHRTALTAPATAIIRRGQLTLAFVVDSDRYARLRPVSIGQTAGDRIEILSGLAAGETLVVNPPPTLVDGTRVAR